LRQNFYFYFQESATFFSGKGEYLNIVSGPFSNSESKYTYDISGYSIVFRPGLQYFLSNRVAIDVAIDLVKYTNHKEKNNTSTDHHKEFQVNLIPNSVTLGLSYRFGGTATE
jgi:outer membrane protein W